MWLGHSTSAGRRCTRGPSQASSPPCGSAPPFDSISRPCAGRWRRCSMAGLQEHRLFRTGGVDMASAYKDGRYWYASFKTASGRWRAVATRAVTKGEAKRIAIELEQREGRVRHGLESALPSDGGGTVGELLNWWLRQTASAPSAVRNVYTIQKHFISSPLARLTLARAQPEDIVNFLDERAAHGGRKGGPLSAQTLDQSTGLSLPRLAAREAQGVLEGEQSAPGCREASRHPLAPGDLPPPGGSSARAGRASPPVAPALRNRALHGASQGRARRAPAPGH